MTDRFAVDGSAGRQVKLATLVRLRWLAVAGQTVAVLFVEAVLGFPLPVAACFMLIALSACLNILLKLRFPANYRLEPRFAAVLLGYDVTQLGGLLFLTGGLENPFATLIVVPVMVSAATLSPRQTVPLGALVLAVTTALAVEHLPVPWHPEEPLNLPIIYVWGLWVALLCAMIFMGTYTFLVAEEARQLATALAATELVLAREQHLSALDGLAAAAAHELGTPLATIALVAKELEREVPSGTPLAEDVALLRSQSERCRDILAKLTSLSAETDWSHGRLPLSSLIDEVVAPHRDFGVAIRIAPPNGSGPEPVGRRNPGTLYGLGNIIENAVDYAAETVEIRTAWNADEVVIEIVDDGPGFASEIIGRLGEPYVTTRAVRTGERPDHEAGGLGLGFFIAKTLLERTGGRVRLANREPPAQGATVTVRWPRAAMDAPGLRDSHSGVPDAASWRAAEERL